MSKHTPGPWRVEEGTTLVWGACNPDDNTSWGMGYPVAEARTKLGHGSPLARSFREDEAVANAHLIAESPHMLEVLREVLAAFSPMPDNGHLTAAAGARRYDALKKVTVAIARAEGRSTPSDSEGV